MSDMTRAQLLAEGARLVSAAKTGPQSELGPVALRTMGTLLAMVQEDAAKLEALEAVHRSLRAELESERERRVAAQEAITLTYIPKLNKCYRERIEARVDLEKVADDCDRLAAEVERLNVSVDRLQQQWATNLPAVAYKARAEQAEAEVTRLRALYNELIMAVASKCPDESRHETALRYITERETTHDNGTKSQLEAQR